MPDAVHRRAALRAARCTTPRARRILGLTVAAAGARGPARAARSSSRTSPSCGARRRSCGARTGWPRWARSPRSWRTRSATRWPRCAARRSCSRQDARGLDGRSGSPTSSSARRTGSAQLVERLPALRPAAAAAAAALRSGRAGRGDPRDARVPIRWRAGWRLERALPDGSRPRWTRISSGRCSSTCCATRCAAAGAGGRVRVTVWQPGGRQARIRVWDSAGSIATGGPGAHLRAVLHHPRGRHRAGAVHGALDRPRARRHDSRSAPRPAKGTEFLVGLAARRSEERSACTILVVDDELSMREYLEVLLAAGRLRGASARRRCRRPRDVLGTGQVDLVISDMKLGQEQRPGGAASAARARDRAPEVILITAYGTPAAAVEAMRAGRLRLHLQALRQRGAEAAGAEGAGEARRCARRTSSCARSLVPGSGLSGSARARRCSRCGALVEKVARQRAPRC